MPFGLKNARETYQSLVDKVFNDKIGQNLKAYVDDMMIKSTSKEDMLMDIQETFDMLISINIKINLKKCSFGVEESAFLGHPITKQGIKANPLKVNEITNLEPPRTLKEIQSLNGKLAALSQFFSKGADGTNFISTVSYTLAVLTPVKIYSQQEQSSLIPVSDSVEAVMANVCIQGLAYDLDQEGDGTGEPMSSYIAKDDPKVTEEAVYITAREDLSCTALISDIIDAENQEAQNSGFLKPGSRNFEYLHHEIYAEVVELEALRIPSDEIKFGKKIDMRGYGTLFEGEYNNQQVALKRLNITNLNNIKPKLLDEILTVARFQKHPNVVALIGFYDENNNEIILVYEYVRSGNLADKMSKHLNTIQRLKICLDVARGLEYLHGHIKLSIILLNSEPKSSRFKAKSSGPAPPPHMGNGQTNRNKPRLRKFSDGVENIGSGAAIAGIMVSILVVGAIIAFFLLKKRSKKSPNDIEKTNNQTYQSADGHSKLRVTTVTRRWVETADVTEVPWSNERPLENKELNAIIGAWFTLWRD
ncbi:tyrosine-protein kinase, non-receptor Jak2 [Tanacetum coccineum]